jgi:hypothetical protein
MGKNLNSFLFLVTYSLSLILFSIQVSQKIQHQAHAKEQMSKIQMRIFISVSIALLCYSIFYVFPSILQMINRVSYEFYKNQHFMMFYSSLQLVPLKHVTQGRSYIRVPGN